MVKKIFPRTPRVRKIVRKLCLSDAGNIYHTVGGRAIFSRIGTLDLAHIHSIFRLSTVTERPFVTLINRFKPLTLQSFFRSYRGQKAQQVLCTLKHASNQRSRFGKAAPKLHKIPHTLRIYVYP